MAYKVIILYRLYMPSYVLGTFTEYPYLCIKRNRIHISMKHASGFHIISESNQNIVF